MSSGSISIPPTGTITGGEPEKVAQDLSANARSGYRISAGIERELCAEKSITRV